MGFLFMDKDGFGCKTVASDSPAEVVVETFFDSNFYGDLTYIPGDIFGAVAPRWTINIPSTISLFRLVSVNKKPCYILARVCDEEIMLGVVKKRIAVLEDKIEK